MFSHLKIGLAVLLLMDTSALLGQSRFLKEGTGGLGAYFVLTSTQGLTNLGGVVAYSAEGIVDFALAYNTILFPDNQLASNQTAYAWKPFVTLHFFKQAPGGMPFSVTTGMGYQKSTYRVTLKTGSSFEITGSQFEYAYSIYRNIAVSESFYFQPIIKYSGLAGDIQTSASSSIVNLFPRNATTSQTSGWLFGFACAEQTSEKFSYYVQPQIILSEGETLYGFSVGVTY